MSTTPRNNEGKAVPGLGRDRLSATLSLDAPVSSLDGVGAKRAASLGNRGIHAVSDLLETFPRRYVDMSCVVDVAASRIGQKCTIVGVVHDVSSRKTRQRGLSLVEVSLVDRTGLIMLVFFNQPWQARKLPVGSRLSVSGEVALNQGFKQMVNPHVVVLEDDELATGIVLPAHPASSDVPRPMMARLIDSALSRVSGCADPLPASLRARYRLCSRYQALRCIHEPRSMDEVAMARRRLIYEELFWLELSLASRSRDRRPDAKPYAQVVAGQGVSRLRFLLPFSLTEEQEGAIDDIFSHMSSPRCMTHLLLGDVGTGKTMVAVFAIVAAVDGGHQALMMGPTEVLVRQYGSSVGSFLDQLGIKWDILTATTSEEDRTRIVADLQSGALSVLMGTHSLLSEDVVPRDCSLMVIDEQQRFGVGQRDAIIAKNPDADVLSMTATPIPRSLALALYGDMSLSYLRNRPRALQPRVTKVCRFKEEGVAYDAIREALARGEQAYIVCPLIGVDTESLSLPNDSDADQEEESVIEYAFVEGLIESGDFDPRGKVVSAATTHARILQESVFPGARVGLLHGKLSSQEKAEVMSGFVDGSIDVLVSTTVIEVGVDVPNATVMVVEDADRFGLSQLHQLRGRVGRGEKPARVFLVSRSLAPQALERLSVMERVDDGFELSERDLGMRREGDVLGFRQHGASSLKLVNVVRDAAIIESAARDARAVLDGDVLSEGERMLVRREFNRKEEGK